MKLSICMMVKNEENNLKRCLDNLHPLAKCGIAELIVVDTGSTDNTVNIAKEYTNKVYFHKWNKDFSEMRNITISYATGEWIFIIDADERLDDFEKLIKLMNSSEINEFNTIILKIKNLVNLSDEDRYDLITSPRIFKNDGKFKYEGSVHNQPIFKGPNLSVDINITHFGYIINDKDLMEKKFKRTTELIQLELKKNPKDLYYIYQLGTSFDMHGDSKEALNEFRKAYNILKFKKSEERVCYSYIYASYARIAYLNNEYNESIKMAKEGIILKKDYIDLYYLVGLIEKIYGNKKESYEYFKKYIELVENYNDLEISKDLSIIMYHVDDKSKSSAYYEVFQYFLSTNNYDYAFKIFNNITNVNEKINAAVNLFVPTKKFSELRKTFNNITTIKDKDIFLCSLQEKIKKIDNIEKLDLYKEFSYNEDNYGLFSKIKISNNQEEQISLTKDLILKLDFNNQPLFYSEVLENIKGNIDFVINTFKEIEEWNLKNIIKNLIEGKEFKKIFENCILNYKDSQNVRIEKVYITIASILLLKHIQVNKKVNQKYINIFKSYINIGISFINNIYRLENAELIYKSVSNQEDRFFILIHIINNFIQKNNQKTAVAYMMEAVHTYEAFAKYIDIYKDEVFKLEGKNRPINENREFEEYKAKVKENISNLINRGLIEEAKSLISEYEQIVKNDVEIYSLKAIISIMENNFDEGERILNNALKLDEKNVDILLNLSYLYSQKTNIAKAIEIYSKAKLFNPDNNVKAKDIINGFKTQDDNNLRVLNGTIEIANQMNTLTEGLSKLGINAKSLNYYPNYLGYKSDYILDVNSFKDVDLLNKKTKNLAAKLISEYDIFHFHFGSSLTLDYSDLPILKELNKKVFMQHWGSDVRIYSKAKEMNRFVKVKVMDEEQIKRKLNFLSKYVSNCIVSDYELYEYVKGIYNNVHLVRQAIDLGKYKFHKTKNNKPLIVHAPSSPEIKGTKYILNAIEKLKEKYEFDFYLVQGIAHEEAKKIYEKADIIIDQILCGSYGLFAIEAMAMGKPVISWISDFMIDKYPSELPIISANPETIGDKIENLLKNRDQLLVLGESGRKYVEKYHDKDLISKQLLELYKSI